MRNPIGTILEKKVIVAGKPKTVWDVRKRYPVLGEDGDPLRDPVTGRRQYRDVTKRCYSKSEANAQLRQLDRLVEEKREREETGITGRRTAAPEIRTFRALAEYYLENYVVPPVVVNNHVVSGLRQNLKALRATINKHIKFFGDRPLTELTYEDIRVYSNNLLSIKTQRGTLPAQASVNRNLAVLRRIFTIGVRLRWIDVNPFTHGEPLIKERLTTRRERVLTFEEEQRMLAVCDEPFQIAIKVRRGKTEHHRIQNQYRPLRPILIMAIDTGMRCNEILNLEWRFVDLEQQTINLPASLTKAWKARIIPVSSRLLAELKELRRHPASFRSPLVFGGRKSVHFVFRSLCRKLGITDLRFHDLRHTATTWMDAAGISTAVKMNIVGHATGQTHQRYNNLSPDIVRAATDAIDRHIALRVR